MDQRYRCDAFLLKVCFFVEMGLKDGNHRDWIQVSKQPSVWFHNTCLYVVQTGLWMVSVLETQYTPPCCSKVPQVFSTQGEMSLVCQSRKWFCSSGEKTLRGGEAEWLGRAQFHRAAKHEKCRQSKQGETSCEANKISCWKCPEPNFHVIFLDKPTTAEYQ